MARRPVTEAVLHDFTCTPFTYGGKTRPVFSAGSGPGVIVIHEVPGITPEVVRFARWVVEAGFQVAMPSLFGVPGKPKSTAYILSSFARTCISREFKCLAAEETSPITDWLRALCRDLHNRCGGPGVGAVGMCLTGNFALALMMEPSMMAPVLSQPSLPLPLGRERKRGLHLSKEALAAAQRRTRDGARILGLRFDTDPACPGERFARLRDSFGDRFEEIEIPGRYAATRMRHSVLTNDLVDETGHPTLAARDRVLAFLTEQLSA
ncbi:MAG: dienelactone hydrolase family protein [Alphaproteobacteria bacterium]